MQLPDRGGTIEHGLRHHDCHVANLITDDDFNAVLKLILEVDHNSNMLWHMLLQNTGAETAMLVTFMLTRLQELADVINPASGSTAYSSACAEVRRAMDEVLHFCGRFSIANSRPEHASKTSIVFRALDVHSGSQEVAIKLMRNKDELHREVERRRQLDPKYAVPVLCHSGEPKFTSRWAEGAKKLGFPQYVHGIIMPLATRGLQEVIIHYHIAGVPERITEVKNIALEIAHALKHLHERGVIHGDLKPLNVMKAGGRWKLIDLDAAAQIGHTVGLKSSTGYAPPELLNNYGLVRNEQNDCALVAHQTFDIWSFGVLLYLLITGEWLFNNNLEDNLRGDEARRLKDWSKRSLKRALKKVRGETRHMLLAKKMLQKLLCADPSDRLSDFQDITDHAFFETGGNGASVHFSFAKDDDGLFDRARGAVQNARYAPSNTIVNEADGAIIIFTEQYKQSVRAQWAEQKEGSLLYSEACGILDKSQSDATFFVYALDFSDSTPLEQMRANLEDHTPRYGPVTQWAEFMEDICDKARAFDLVPQTRMLDAVGTKDSVHFSYSREDSELLYKSIEMVRRTDYKPTVILWGQSDDWFGAWEKQLSEADGVVVLFTKGDSFEKAVLGNNGSGYEEKAATRFAQQGEDSALHKEAMAIRRMKERNADFFIYVIDGRNFTAAQLRESLETEQESFGPVEEWHNFIDRLPKIARALPPAVPTFGRSSSDGAVLALQETAHAQQQQEAAQQVVFATAVASKEAEREAADASALTSKEAERQAVAVAVAAVAVACVSVIAGCSWMAGKGRSWRW
jgi:serine/threonine protein kinase